MYNSLREIREALSTKDLYKYGELANNKTAEEIIEMLKNYNIDISLAAAKEAVEALIDFDNIEVQDQELADVAGGTCFSGGITDPQTGISKKYAIVSPWNICPTNKLTEYLPTRRLCDSCDKHFVIKGKWYCRDRWEGHNTPARKDNSLTFIDD